MTHSIFRHAVLLFLLLPGISLAEEVKDLYEVDVVVEDKGADTRQSALREAMATVLIRVSGHTDVILHPVIQTALAKPQDYTRIYQYLYLQKSGSRERVQVLRVSLSELNINTLLRDAHLPIWGKSRPGMLVWLAVDNGKQRSLLGATHDNWMSSELNDAAQAHGMPIQLPLLDAQDQSQVQLSDVWGGFNQNILSASRRYQNPAVLVGRVYLDSDRIWHARWTLLFNNDSLSWEVQGKRLASVLDQGMEEASMRVAFEYAYVQSDKTQAVYLQVQNVHTLQDMVRVQKYLQSQVGVREAQPMEIRDGEVFFKLTLDGRWATIAQSIALGNLLVETAPTPTPVQTTTTAPPPKGGGIPEDLIFRYRYLP